MSGVDVSCLGTDSEAVDSFLSSLRGLFKLRNDPLSETETEPEPEAEPEPEPDAIEPMRSAVSILGALSSASQLHFSERESQQGTKTAPP